MRVGALGLVLAFGCTRQPTSEEAPVAHDLPHAEPEPTCSLAELEHAPPPTTVDGLPAVPIDVIELAARIEFDAATGQARASATLRFRLGDAAGMPIFDLRQQPTFAALDGQPIDPAALARHDFGMGQASGMRVLEVELPACTTHELVVDHPLERPDAPLAQGPIFSTEPARLHFDVWMSDLHPGRYLESWLPTTLPYDEFSLTLEIDLLGAEVEHALISNAEVESLGEHAWLLEFPPSTRPMSPLIAIAPREDWTIATGTHAAASGQDIDWTLVLDASVTTPIDVVIAEVGDRLDEFVISTGAYPHPRLTMILGAERRSMEYDGAFTAKPSALTHELFHSWWGRGVHPARHADGWIDEAWDVYNTGSGRRFAVEPFVATARPVVLAHPHPFSRAMPNSAYSQGRRVFAGLAAAIGVEPLRTTMARIFAERSNAAITTEELQRILYCENGRSADVQLGFHRFVHGLAEPPPALPANWCD
ncbi:hypothetical protein ACNOYE_35975 [Nannocystaceae bacterium ST9]